MIKNFFNRLVRKDEEPIHSGPVEVSIDGWVDMTNGRLVVHDPAETGRYATLTPGTGVRLWINDEEVNEPTAVTSQDRIRFDLAIDPSGFFDLYMSEDRMTVEIFVSADPFRLPDTVALDGRNQVQLQPSYSPRAKQRPIPPKQIILDRLRSLGVTSGIDEGALDQALSQSRTNPAVIARGQQAQAPTPGEWVWRLDEWSLVDGGQVIASYQAGSPNLPRVTVRGESTRLFEDLPEPQVYLPGNGTRMLPGGRLVASASGRARPVATPQGSRVHIFPVHRVDGDLEGDLEVQADVIVFGHMRSAKVITNGECYVTGNVERSEIRADVITIRGAAIESKLYTVAIGHFVPLRTELIWVQHRIEEMREAIHGHKPTPVETFREVSNFVRAVRRKAEQVGINHPEYVTTMEAVAKVFLGAQTSLLDLPTAGHLLMGLGKLQKSGEQLVHGARDITAHSMSHVTAWAGRNIIVQERIVGCYLFCGGALRTREDATIGQSEILVAGEVNVGTLASARGSAPVTIRAGGRVEAFEVQAGCVFEFGSEHREFKSDLVKIAASVNAKGQLIVRQRD